MLATRRVAALAITAAVTAGACGGGSKAVVRLDGSPRHPDTEGVVVEASSEGITLDGQRRFGVSPKLISFSTYNQSVVRLATTRGAYVQAGVDDGTIVWLSKIGPVSTAANGHRTAQYQGNLVDIDGRKLIFEDGTVLRLASGLTPPKDPFGPAYVVIDADKHVVQGATFASPRDQN